MRDQRQAAGNAPHSERNNANANAHPLPAPRVEVGFGWEVVQAVYDRLKIAFDLLKIVSCHIDKNLKACDAAFHTVIDATSITTLQG